MSAVIQPDDEDPGCQYCRDDYPEMHAGCVEGYNGSGELCPGAHPPHVRESANLGGTLVVGDW